MSDFIIGLSLGASAGFFTAWMYFLSVGLIRSRKEYYQNRKDKGLSVPSDWDKEE